jgi:hypothetical protein
VILNLTFPSSCKYKLKVPLKPTKWHMRRSIDEILVRFLHWLFRLQDSVSLSMCSHSLLEFVSQLRYIMIKLRGDKNQKARNRLLRSCPLTQYNAVATIPDKLPGPNSSPRAPCAKQLSQFITILYPRERTPWGEGIFHTEHDDFEFARPLLSFFSVDICLYFRTLQLTPQELIKAPPNISRKSRLFRWS